MSEVVSASVSSERRRRRHLRAFVAVVALGSAVLAACEPTAPPPGIGGSATAPPAASGSATVQTAPPSVAAGPPTVTMEGDTAVIVGLGNGKSPTFTLPAGDATMTITPCESNDVIPFVSFFDGDDNRLGLIVEATYQARDLEGGEYYVDVAANPDCAWQIEVAPA